MEKHHIRIGRMSCSFCAETIKKALTRVDGVSKVNVSLAHEEALIEYDPEKVDAGRLDEILMQLGYTVRDPRKMRTFEEEEVEIKREKQRLLISAVFTGVAVVLMILMRLGYQHLWFKWLMMGLALMTVFGPGFYILKMALYSLRRGILNQHVLLEFGAFAGLTGGFVGFLIKDFPIADFFAVAVFITTYHILSGYTSLIVRTRASQAVRKLLDLQPQKARVIRDGKEKMVPIEGVVKGDLVSIRPGERIPVDGEVIDGYSAVDESIVTGESIPIDKKLGDEVIGGSYNQLGNLLVRVSRIGEESFLQQIARHIEEARAMKPGIVQVVDKVLKYYVPVVLLFAAAGMVIWTVGAWLIKGETNLIRGTFAALAVLIMGYPCALGMATPLAMIRGGGLAAEKGILMRSSNAFQAFKEVKKLILDKTGTITKGKPEVTEVVSLSKIPDREIIMMAASVEKHSEHPLGKSVVEHAQSLGVELKKVKKFSAVPGEGVRAEMGGKVIRVGSLRYLKKEGVLISRGSQEAKALEQQGKTVIAVSVGRELVGLIAVADALKEDAVEAIRRIKEAGLEPVMITGDNQLIARVVANAVGIEEVIAEVLPEEKAEKIRKLQEDGYRVAMVGDGINDAPALMQADIGIAIGTGTDIAIESADVVLIGGSLNAIVDAYYIGKNSYKKTVQNLILAFSFNGIGVPAATTGLVHPVWAMVAMVASVSTVLLNSFGGRLLPTRRKFNKELRKVTFRVPTMHCEKCLSTIAKRLSEIEGVNDIKGSVLEKTVTVTCDGKRGLEKKLREEITKLGHVAG